MKTPQFRTAPGLAMLGLVACLSTVFIMPLRAEILPHTSIEYNAMTADLVLAGTHLGDGKVRVSQIFYSTKEEIKACNSIEAPFVAKHSRRINHMFGADGVEIETKRLVLFLEFDENGLLQPLHQFGDGSQGLIWYSDEQCYGYGQMINPGPYVLHSMRASSENRGAIPFGKDVLWERIEAAIEQRAIWNEVRAIEPLERRARAMAAMMLVKEFAPQRGYSLDQKVYAAGFEGADFEGEFEKIGPPAVEAIVEVLSHQEPFKAPARLSSILLDIVEKAPKDERAELLSQVVPVLIKWTTPFFSY